MNCLPFRLLAGVSFLVANLDKLTHSLEWMGDIQVKLFSKVPPPKRVQIGRQIAYRFIEESLEQAIIIKLARIVSGLRASQLLLENGLLQEQASMCRMVDEYGEDVSFLSLAIISGERSAHHEQFLDALFKEEVRSNSPKEDWSKGRQMVPRKKVRSYIANHSLSSPNPSDAIATYTLIGNVYSGYVHAAACQVLEMYDPVTNKFRMDNMGQSKFFADHCSDIDKYFSRACYAFAIAAFAMGERKISQDSHALADNFAGI